MAISFFSLLQASISARNVRKIHTEAKNYIVEHLYHAKTYENALYVAQHKRNNFA